VAHQILSVEVERLSVETLAPRWLPPVGTLFAAAVTLVRRRVAEPGMPRMSSEWLLSHDRFGGNRYSH
jgi:hypothetical protein